VEEEEEEEIVLVKIFIFQNETIMNRAQIMCYSLEILRSVSVAVSS
jgi:hypothetical protein